MTCVLFHSGQWAGLADSWISHSWRKITREPPALPSLAPAPLISGEDSAPFTQVLWTIVMKNFHNAEVQLTEEAGSVTNTNASKIQGTGVRTVRNQSHIGVERMWKRPSVRGT